MAQGSIETPVSAPSRSLGQLFDEAWQIYRRRWKTLTGLFLTVYLVLLLPGLLGISCSLLMATWWPEMERALLISGGLTGMLVGLAAMIWAYIALVVATVEEQSSFRTALKNSVPLFGPFLWCLSLASFLITGTLLLLFLPGLLMTVWFFFVPFVLVDQKLSGQRALYQSQQLVNGHFWEVCGKFLIATLIPSAIGAVPVAGPFLAILAVPYVMIMLFLIYEDQKRRCPPHQPAETKPLPVCLWWGLAIAGYLFITASALWLIARTDFKWESSWPLISCITDLACNF